MEEGRGAEKEFWSLKPWWCQPWSLLLTGAMAIGGSSWIFHSRWFSLVVTALVVGWWWMFLVRVPHTYRQWLQSRSGQEQSGEGHAEG